MNRKKILVWALTLSIVASASAVTYASQKTDSTKNVVVTLEDKDNNAGQQETISDEKAVKAVAETMKKYIEKDLKPLLKNKVYNTTKDVSQNKEVKKKYEKEHSKDSSNNEVYSGNNVGQGETISDKDAIKIAEAAMKNYMGVDEGYFGSYQVLRSVDIEKQSQEYAKEHRQDIEDLNASYKIYEKNHPEDAKVEKENSTKLKSDRLVTVWFTPKDYNENNANSNYVFINEKNGEIVSIGINRGLDENLHTKIDDNRVVDGTFNFLGKIGMGIKGNAIKVEKQVEFGRITVHYTLDDGRNAEIEIDPRDYRVITYSVNYDDIKTIPSQKKETRDIHIPINQ